MRELSDEVLAIFNDLPDPFKLSDVKKLCKLEEHQISYQLQVMAMLDMDIIHKKGGERLWNKTYTTIEKWFKAHVKRLRKQLIMEKEE